MSVLNDLNRLVNHHDMSVDNILDELDSFNDCMEEIDQERLIIDFNEDFDTNVSNPEIITNELARMHNRDEINLYHFITWLELDEDDREKLYQNHELFYPLFLEVDAPERVEREYPPVELEQDGGYYYREYRRYKNLYKKLKSQMYSH